MEAVIYTPVVGRDMHVSYVTRSINVNSPGDIMAALGCQMYSRISDPCDGHIAIKSNDPCTACNSGLLPLTKFTWHNTLVPGPILVIGCNAGVLAPSAINPAQIIDSIEGIRLYSQATQRFDHDKLH